MTKIDLFAKLVPPLLVGKPSQRLFHCRARIFRVASELWLIFPSSSIYPFFSKWFVQNFVNRQKIRHFEASLWTFYAQPKMFQLQ